MALPLHLAPVVQRLDKYTQTNRYPGEKCWQNKLHYLLGRDLSAGWCYVAFEQLGPDWLRRPRSVGTIEKASERQAGSAMSGIRERKDPARRSPAFPIVPTDREPGTR